LLFQILKIKQVTRMTSNHDWNGRIILWFEKIKILVMLLTCLVMLAFSNFKNKTSNKNNKTSM